MGEKILVAYASLLGSTSAVAEYVGQTLRENGDEVDVRHIDDVTDLSPYHALILGGAIRFEKPLPELETFIRTYLEALRKKPVACFILSLTMRIDSEENRLKVFSWLAPLVDILKPVDLGLFAGALRYGRLSPILRIYLRMTGKPQGDFRDWQTIRKWALGLHEKFDVSVNDKKAVKQPG